MSLNNQTILSYSDIDWDKAQDSLPYRVSNDYLFRALMQRNNHVLKAFVCDLLHLEQSEVSSIVITNPIELGKAINDKDYILDIRIELNRKVLINLEMQIADEGNWTERSLCYLCRTFDSLNRGEKYIDVQPAIQIGILDFPLFPDRPEFYATYRLRNDRTGELYSDKLRLSVLELRQTNLATEEDKRYRLDLWARFFKAKTWEELKMLAKNNTDFQEAITTTYQLSQDEKIRMQCEAREDFYRRTKGRERLLRETILEKNQLVTENEQLTSEKEQLAFKNEQLVSENERYRQLLAAHGIDVDSVEK